MKTSNMIVADDGRRATMSRLVVKDLSAIAVWAVIIIVGSIAMAYASMVVSAHAGWDKQQLGSWLSDEQATTSRIIPATVEGSDATDPELGDAIAKAIATRSADYPSLSVILPASPAGRPTIVAASRKAHTVTLPRRAKKLLEQGHAVVLGTRHEVNTLKAEDKTLKLGDVALTALRDSVHKVDVLGPNDKPLSMTHGPVVILPVGLLDEIHGIPAGQLIAGIVCDCAPGRLSHLADELSQVAFQRGSSTTYVAATSRAVFGPAQRSSALAGIITPLIFAGALLAVYLLAGAALAMMWRRRLNSYTTYIARTRSTGLPIRRYSFVVAALITVPTIIGFIAGYISASGGSGIVTLSGVDLIGAIVLALIAHLALTWPAISKINQLNATRPKRVR